MAFEPHDPVLLDQPTRIGRRRALGLLSGLGLTAVVGGIAACSSSDDDADGAASGAGGTTSSDATSTTVAADTAGTQTTVTCAGAIPEETAGPYPADGTNGPNVLTEDGVVRSDIRSSFGSGAGGADGVPLAIELTMVDAASCTVLPGAAVYLWHCDREGRYSLYSDGATDANFLRGVQAADANGVVRFTTSFPGAYSGRWPHIHFEVFDGLEAATNGRNATRTSQLALPQVVCEQVYAASGYESSAQNLDRSELSADNVFRDGVDLQLATVSGSIDAGYTARLVVGI